MPESETPKATYPYMTASQFNGVRLRLRQSLPKEVNVDWVMAALGTTEKMARNIQPQLRRLGLITEEGAAPTDIAQDLRDDSSYGDACRRILESVYPESLRDSYNNPEAEPEDVARWFMRNAKTGERAALLQAKLYVALLKGEIPSDSGTITPAAVTARKAAAPRTSTQDSGKGAPRKHAARKQELRDSSTDEVDSRSLNNPNLNIDLQIHVSADASDEQIDLIFRSLAKHVYGRTID